MTNVPDDYNTYIFDTESASEMARLTEQGRTLTTGAGGPWTGLPDLPPGSQVIDLGCGPGGWVLDVAHLFPRIEVAGVDISQIMIQYASARARTQGLSNATFEIMNVLKPLDFSDNTFDVVNVRSLFSVLRREAWKPFLSECQRILKPGGTLRVTDLNDFGVTSSPAIERLQAQGALLMWKAGYGFSVDGRSFGITPRMPSLLRELNYNNVHTKAFALEFSAGTEAWPDFYRNFEVTFIQGRTMNIQGKFFTDTEYDQLFQQFLIDIRSDDFWGVCQIVSTFGQKPR